MAMRQLTGIILLFIPFYSMHAQEHITGVTGEYYLEGVMETASVFQLNPDSSFNFFFSYGALDRSAKNTIISLFVLNPG
jgi:hypothetical protein